MLFVSVLHKNKPNADEQDVHLCQYRGPNLTFVFPPKSLNDTEIKH